MARLPAAFVGPAILRTHNRIKSAAIGLNFLRQQSCEAANRFHYERGVGGILGRPGSKEMESPVRSATASGVLVVARHLAPFAANELRLAAR